MAKIIFQLLLITIATSTNLVGQVNHKGSVTEFKPYVSQIPDVLKAPPVNFNYQSNNNRGFQSGKNRIQNALDNLYALEIINDGGKIYLQNRINELVEALNKFSYADLSIQNNVDQLLTLFNPIYQDQNIIEDAKNSKIYKNWLRQAISNLGEGTMEPLEYQWEREKADEWKSSKTAGVEYKGYSIPNTLMMKDVDAKLNRLVASLKNVDKTTKKSYYIINGIKYLNGNQDDATKILFLIVDNFLEPNERSLYYHILTMEIKNLKK